MKLRCINTMEALVENAYEDLRPELGCCDCERCRTDIICYALNHVPPRYADTAEGAKIVEAMMSRRQDLTDIRSTILKGAAIVGANPRH